MKAKFIAVLLLFVTAVSAQTNALPSKPSAKKPPVVAHKIDLNTADLTELIGSVKGIGKKRAEAIIAYRTSHHGFKSLEEFAEIKGLGRNFLEANRTRLNDVFIIKQIE